MKTSLTVDIALEVADEQEVAHIEDALHAWLEGQKGVTGMRVLHQGDLSGIAWRDARRRAFGPALQNPFARASGEH